MSNEDKHSGGPKIDNGKTTSSYNSITHGLTARKLDKYQGTVTIQ
jgi:hypothetical protein